MDIGDLLFGFKGRLSVVQFWGGVIVLLMVAFGLFGIYLAIFGSLFSTDYVDSLLPGTAELRRMWPVVIPLLFFIIGLLWSSSALIVKRFHDLNKSGLWLIGPLCPILIMVFNLPIGLMIGFWTTFWFSLELFFKLGTRGPNQFGPGSRKYAVSGDEAGETSLKESLDADWAAQAFASLPPEMNAHPVATTQIFRPTAPTGGFGRRGV